MVGGTLLLLRNKEGTAALLAQGSFACLALLGAYSSIVDGMAVFAEASGAARRVVELLDRQGTSAEQSSSIQAAAAFQEDKTAMISRAELHCDDNGVAMTAVTRYAYLEGATAVQQPLLADFSTERVNIGGTFRHTFRENSSASPERGRLLLRAESMHVRSPAGKILIASLSLEIREGMRVLVRGPSGCGKSTLLQVRFPASFS